MLATTPNNNKNTANNSIVSGSIHLSKTKNQQATAALNKRAQVPDKTSPILNKTPLQPNKAPLEPNKVTQ